VGLEPVCNVVLEKLRLVNQTCFHKLRPLGRGS
jgi:hypothetical protein